MRGSFKGKIKLFKAMILISGSFAALTVSCATAAPPFEFTETFNISSEHFNEIRRGPWEKIENTRYRIVLDQENKTIHVRGRGSNDADMKDNLDFAIRKISEDWFPGTDGKVKVHRGFFRRYRNVREILLETGNNYPDFAIRVSGFSLGGAWTQLFLLDAIQHWPERDIKAIFYAPANPWRKLPKEYQEELKKRTVFVRSYWDAVTWMRAIGFYRYGHNITIGKWWRVFPPQHYPPQMIRSLDEKFPAPKPAP